MNFSVYGYKSPKLLDEISFDDQTNKFSYKYENYEFVSKESYAEDKYYNGPLMFMQKDESMQIPDAVILDLAKHLSDECDCIVEVAFVRKCDGQFLNLTYLDGVCVKDYMSPDMALTQLVKQAKANSIFI